MPTGKIFALTSLKVRQDTQTHKVITQLNFLLFNVFKCLMKHKINISCFGWVHNSRLSDKVSQSSWLDFKTLGIGTVCLFCEYKNKTEEKRRLDLVTCTFTVAQRKRVGNRLTKRPLVAPVVEERKR